MVKKQQKHSKAVKVSEDEESNAFGSDHDDFYAPELDDPELDEFGLEDYGDDNDAPDVVKKDDAQKKHDR